MQNLIKIQEDLKGLPTQAIMGYANGQNPEVPPYIALAELNRRKQLEQSAQTQSAPQQEGTIKDRITQDVGLMHLQNQRQQQALQSIGQQAQRAPQSNPMPAMAGGGIVALAEGGEAGQQQQILDSMSEDELQAYRIAKTKERLGWGAQLPQGATERPADILRRAANAGPQLPLPGSAQATSQPTATSTAQPSPETQQTPPPAAGDRKAGLPDLLGGGGRERVSMGASVRGAGMPGGGLGQVMKDLNMPMPTAPQAPEYGSQLAKAMGIMDPYLKAEEEKKQAYIQLLRDQQAAREKEDPMGRVMAFLGGATGRPGEHWSTSMAGSGDAYLRALAEQRKIGEEATRQIATEETGIAALRRGEAEKQLEKSSKHTEDVFKTQGSMFSHEQAAAMGGRKALLDYDANLRQIAAQLQVARERGASGNDLIKWVESERKGLADELRSLDTELKTAFGQAKKELADRKDAITSRIAALDVVRQQHIPGLSEALNKAGAGVGAAGRNKVVDFSTIK